MNEDPIVAEVRRVRDNLARQFNYDSPFESAFVSVNQRLKVFRSMRSVTAIHFA